MDLKIEYFKKKAEIELRLLDFKKVKNDGLFYELCFCLLTPQSSGFRADDCIKILKQKNFLNSKINPKPILRKRIRFHNNKTKYLLKLKKDFKIIKEKIESSNNKEGLRLWLLKNVTGYGLKESSHLMRNIGFENLAILDRHILKNLKKHNVIDELPKSLTCKKYFEIENKFKAFSEEIKIPMDHLDLLFWSQETGKIFK